MKTLKTLSVLLLSVGLLLTSCKKKDTTEDTPADQDPSISLVAGSGYTSADVTANVGTTLKVVYIALSNTNSSSKLDKVYGKLTSNNIIVADTTYIIAGSVISHKDSVSITLSTAGTSRLEFTVTDKAGKTASVAINITAVVVAPPTSAIGTGVIILGGSVDSHPSYLDLSATGTTYLTSAVNAGNAANIDLVYNKTKVLSPSDPAVTNTTVSGAGVITKMDVYTAKAYSAITDADIDAYVPTNAINATVANGTVIMFQTAGGKKGVFHLTAFSGSSTSTTTDNISIEGKVQQ